MMNVYDEQGSPEKTPNACEVEYTLAVSEVDSISGTGRDMKLHGRAQASSTNNSLESIELVNQGVEKLFRQRRIRFTIKPNLI